MSWYNTEDWIHVDEYADVVQERDELKRQLKVADEDTLWLEQTNTQLRQELDYLKAEIKYLEEKLGATV